MQDEANDADGLSPVKEDNNILRKSHRKDLGFLSGVSIKHYIDYYNNNAFQLSQKEWARYGTGLIIR